MALKSVRARGNSCQGVVSTLPFRAKPFLALFLLYLLPFKRYRQKTNFLIFYLGIFFKIQWVFGFIDRLWIQKNPNDKLKCLNKSLFLRVWAKICFYLKNWGGEFLGKWFYGTKYYFSETMKLIWTPWDRFRLEKNPYDNFKCQKIMVPYGLD